ncbi:MAG: isochorismatase family protein [Methylophilaceae bacterium]|nr:isochorismatase family protein [Methylophilaceae bacterium]
MKRATLSRKPLSQLVVIDVQERLCGAMPAQELGGVLRNVEILLQAAAILAVPILYTEQAPAKLGTTLPRLTRWLPADGRVEKTCFSCYEESQFRAKLDETRPQIILTGMEAHICVAQTALQLLEDDHHQVFVVEDAVISRNPAHKTNALARLRQAGGIVTNTESVVFEWLENAENDAFKQIAGLVK